jgi:hypothetical protein
MILWPFRGTLQLPVPDELEGVTNGSLANIIRWVRLGTQSACSIQFSFWFYLNKKPRNRFIRWYQPIILIRDFVRFPQELPGTYTYLPYLVVRGNWWWYHTYPVPVPINVALSVTKSVAIDFVQIVSCHISDTLMTDWRNERLIEWMIGWSICAFMLV